jgi:hypothetical protein
MHLLFDIILFSTFISSYLCVNNLTYVFSQVSTSTTQSLIYPNGYILANPSYVTRLSSTSANLINSIQTLQGYNATQAIVFSWNTGDCSLPSALALTYPSIKISSPICFTDISISITNIYQLTVTSKQLASAATMFMEQYSLTYFSLIISSSNDFYFNLAEKFSSYLTENSYILEQFLIGSNFTQSSLSSRSKG